MPSVVEGTKRYYSKILLSEMALEFEKNWQICASSLEKAVSNLESSVKYFQSTHNARNSAEVSLHSAAATLSVIFGSYDDVRSLFLFFLIAHLSIR